MAHMTSIPESGTRREPIEPAVGKAVFTNLMACFRCDNCAALNICSMWTGDVINPDLDAAGITEVLAHPDPAFPAETLWYPPRIGGKRYPAVPTEIAGAASEAHKCITAGAYRGAVILARSVIEATAKNKGMASGSLMSKIDAMHAAGLIREDIKDGAHEVRFLANEAAYGELAEPVPGADAELILTLMDEVLEEIYQSPARVARRRAARIAKDIGA
jgi:Domain of unknown function (DUF4145)